MFLWCTPSSLTQHSVTRWRLILSSGLEVFLFSSLSLAAASRPNNCSPLHHKSLNPGIFIILWSRCCKTYSAFTMQCQHWHIGEVLNAIIILDNARPFTDSGHISGLQIRAHQRSLQSAPRAAYTQIEKDIFTAVVMAVQHDSSKTQHRLMDLSKQAPWPFGWVRGWGAGEGRFCFHAAELSEPRQSQNTHTPYSIGKHSPEW